MSLQKKIRKNINPVRKSVEEPVEESLSVFEQAEVYLQEGFFGFGKKKKPMDTVSVTPISDCRKQIVSVIKTSLKDKSLDPKFKKSFSNIGVVDPDEYPNEYIMGEYDLWDYSNNGRGDFDEWNDQFCEIFAKNSESPDKTVRV